MSNNAIQTPAIDRLKYQSLDHPASLSPADPRSPWTASRCLRLLRPLSSRIAQLKRELRRPDLLEGSVSVLQDTGDVAGDGQDGRWMPDVAGASRGRIRRRYTSRRTQHSVGLKEGSGNRRIGSDTARKRAALGFGQLSLPTPLIIRCLGPDVGSGDALPPSAWGNLETEETDSVVPRRLYHKTCQQKENGSATHSAVDRRPARPFECWSSSLSMAIRKDLESLLVATEPKPQNPRGAGSLMSMCLRNIPELIRTDQDEADSSRSLERCDIADDVYNHLEDQYSVSHKGWKPLRELTRWHGIEMLCHAIRSNIIDLDVALSLSHTCREHKAYRESVKILACYTNVMTERLKKPVFYDQSLLSANAPYLANLSCIMPPTNILYSIVPFPLYFTDAVDAKGDGWAQGVEVILKLALTSIARADGHSPNAARLVASLQLTSCQIYPSDLISRIHDMRIKHADDAVAIPDERIHSGPQLDSSESSRYSLEAWPMHIEATVHSIAAMTVAIDLLRASSDEGNALDYARQHEPITSHLSLFVHQHRQVHILSQHNNKYKLRVLGTVRILLGHLFLLKHISGSSRASQFQGGVDEEMTIDFLNEILSGGIEGSQLVKPIVSFICSIVHFCGKAHHDDGFNQIQRLVSILIDPDRRQLTKDTPSPALLFLESIAVETAIAFSEQHGAKRYFDWASDIDANIYARQNMDGGGSGNRSEIKQNGRLPAVAAKPHMVQSFRWEDSICEWVMRTPLRTVPQSYDLSKQPTTLSIPLSLSSIASPTNHLLGSEESSASDSTDVSDTRNIYSPPLRNMRWPRGQDDRPVPVPKPLYKRNGLSNDGSYQQEDEPSSTSTCFRPSKRLKISKRQITISKHLRSDDTDELSVEMAPMPTSPLSQILPLPRPAYRTSRHRPRDDRDASESEDEIGISTATFSLSYRVDTDRDNSKDGWMKDTLETAGLAGEGNEDAVADAESESGSEDELGL